MPTVYVRRVTLKSSLALSQRCCMLAPFRLRSRWRGCTRVLLRHFCAGVNSRALLAPVRCDNRDTPPPSR